MQTYKMVKRDGITAALTNNGKILIVKRIKIPFISHPGRWSFVAGRRERKERYLQAAYREIMEETKIQAGELTLLNGDTRITLKDGKSRSKWANRFFIFRSESRTVRLNIENTTYKWVSFSQLCRNRDLNSMLCNKMQVFSLIRSCMRL